MRGFLTLVLGTCLAGTLAAQQPQPNRAGGTLWISAGEPARLIVNGETVGLVNRLRVLSVPFRAHNVRVESTRESSASLEKTVVVSSDQPVPVTFNLGQRVNELWQARALADRRARDERDAPSMARLSVKVTDAETGLEWAGRDSEGPVSWANATAFCESLVLGGADDWRLPSVEQVEMLFAVVGGRNLEENRNGELWYPVPGVRASHTRFWSSTRTTTSPTLTDPITGNEIRRPVALGAWSVGFGSAEYRRILHADIEAPAGAMCVRG